MSQIVEFSLARGYGEGAKEGYAGLPSMRFFESREPKVGSLVAINSAPATKWYLSWVHEVKRIKEGGDCIYFLESIEDGELCWWGNIAIWEYNRERVEGNPQWRWTDEQHKFNQRWYRALKNRPENYNYRPNRVEFISDKEVILSIYRSFDFDDPKYRAEKRFNDYRKVTAKMMVEFYKQAIK